MSLFFRRLKAKPLSRFSLFSVATAVLGGVALVVVAYLFPVNGISGEGLPRFLGRFHPLVLHFPVALLPLALFIEFLRFAPKRWHRWRSVSLPLLTFAAFFAVLTAILGILLAANEGHAGELVERHRTFGIAVAAMTIVALGLRLLMDVLTHHHFLTPALLGTLSVTSVVMVLAAHDGGNMVHGQHYLAQYAPASLKPILANKQASSLSGHKTVVPEELALQRAYSNDIAPILERHCASCHGPSRQNGNIRFDELSPVMSSDHDVAVWSSVRDALNAHQMPPPEEARQPSTQERQSIIAWIDNAFEQVAKQRRENRASPLRRLTVKEYEITLQELFGTAFQFSAPLPSAPKSEHGYSRDASLLSVSSLELEYFLDIARESVDNYVLFDERMPDTEHFLVEIENVDYRPGVDGNFTYGLPLTEQERSAQRQTRGAKPGVYSQRTLFPMHEGPIPPDANQVVRPIIQKFSDQFARFYSKQPHRSGELIAKVKVAAKLGADGSAPRLRFRVGVTAGSEIAASDPLECDVVAPIETPQTCIFRVPLRHMPVIFGEEETMLTFFLFNASHHPDAVYGIVPEGLNFSPKRPRLVKRYEKWESEAIVSKATMREAGLNELYLDAVEIDIIPFGADTSAPVWRVDVASAERDSGAKAREVAEETLRAFMERAYRRSVIQSELDEMLTLYDEFRAEGDRFKQALKETLSTVLISDPFLYIAAPVPLGDDDRISDEESSQLASRLSYFIWSGPPDDRLLELASQNRLSDPATLAHEVKRMLSDSRARRFSRQFVNEWLHLDKHDLIAVNPEFYPLYDEDLGADMVAETIATFQAIFHGQKDARELISSDTVYINQRLARHYGFPAGVTGGDMQPVAVPASQARGGLLRHAAVLTMTGDGAESNPIHRGVWILERLLNDPPPPPPPSVPPLEVSPEQVGKLTLKQKIELHAEQSACAACHAKIDPWGLPLENYDAIGAWRDEALVIHPDTADQSFVPIDSTTTLNTGERIRGVNELVDYLFHEREDEFTAALTWHMMAYALGRAPNLGDENELKTIHQYFKISGYNMQALVLAIVQSEAFQATPDHLQAEKFAADPSEIHTASHTE